jgi:signal transduction histidine kinase
LPLIRRLRILSAKINNIELDKPNFKINDKHNDEIGAISRTFDKMANNINENFYNMKKFYHDRQELLKNISHDFRTPLTSILGYSISLDEGMHESEDERKKHIQIIRKKATYMSDLFNEMMELTRLDNNSYLLNKATFNIAEMIREIIIEYLPQLEKEEFFIETEIPESIIIDADKERLSRAIRNIIENVIKHANDGKYIGILVIKNKNSTITISIKDKGKGIEDKDKKKIFTRFYRNSKKSGMGLGLAITKEIIEKHNGAIKFESASKKGTSFIIKLPLK